jgi:hypothetical protein
MQLIPPATAIVGLLLGVAVNTWIIRRLGLRETQEVQTGRVGDQPIIEYREKTWVTLAMLLAGLLGAGAGAAAGWYLVRCLEGG